jgi:hypothetical protein
MEQWYLLVMAETEQPLSRPFRSPLTSAKRLAGDLAGQLRKPVDLYAYQYENWCKTDTVYPVEESDRIPCG